MGKHEIFPVSKLFSETKAEQLFNQWIENLRRRWFLYLGLAALVGVTGAVLAQDHLIRGNVMLSQIGLQIIWDFDNFGDKQIHLAFGKAPASVTGLYAAVGKHTQQYVFSAFAPGNLPLFAMDYYHTDGQDINYQQTAAAVHLGNITAFLDANEASTCARLINEKFHSTVAEVCQ